MYGDGFWNNNTTNTPINGSPNTIDEFQRNIFFNKYFFNTKNSDGREESTALGADW